MKPLGPLFIQAAGHRPGRRIPGATAGALAARLAILAVPSSDPIMAGAFRASEVKFLLLGSLRLGVSIALKPTWDDDQFRRLPAKDLGRSRC